MLDGKIALSSVYGEGSTFSVSLTQQIIDKTTIKEYNKDYAEEEKERRLFVSHETKVLVCDDNKINLLVMEGMLEIYELDVTYVSSGKEAIDSVVGGEYDIIMMDHMMPEMDGIEATSHIRTICASRPKKPYIIALTANTFEGAKEMFLTRGFDNFLPKPVDKIALYEMLLGIIPDSKLEFIEDDVAPLSYSEDDLAELYMDDIDVRKAMERREGSINDYLKVLELYYLEGSDRIDGIKGAYESKDFKNYEIFVHGLKSTSLSIGADGLSDLAKAHEYAAKDNNIQFIDDNFDKLCNEYDKILEEIKGVLIRKGVTAKVSDEDKLEGMDANQLKYRLRKVLSLSEDFRSREAYDELQALFKYRLDDDIQKRVEEIGLAFKTYDDDGAEDKIKSLLEDIENGKGEGNEQ